jgi:small conductance mechanosensitive channel
LRIVMPPMPPGGFMKPETGMALAPTLHLKPQHVSTAWHTANQMLSHFIQLLPDVVLACAVFIVFVIVAGVANYAVKHIGMRRGVRENVAVLLGRATQLIIVIIGVLAAIPFVSSSFKLGNLIATLGIGSVAIGFAFQNILQNFLAGVILLVHEPFRIGDHISVSGFEGVVDEIQVRSTIVRTQDGHRVVIPNSTVFQNPVVVRDMDAAHLPPADKQLANESKI